MSTIFTKIVNKEIPAHIVYEDNNYLAFLDIHPKTKGHTLLIPKQEYTWVYDVPNMGEYFEVAKKVALTIKKALGATYISFQTFGTEIPHAHIHIVPFYSLTEEYSRTKYSHDELKEIAEKIRKQDE